MLAAKLLQVSISYLNLGQWARGWEANMAQQFTPWQKMKSFERQIRNLESNWRERIREREAACKAEEDNVIIAEPFDYCVCKAPLTYYNNGKCNLCGKLLYDYNYFLLRGVWPIPSPRWPETCYKIHEYWYWRRISLPYCYSFDKFKLWASPTNWPHEANSKEPLDSNFLPESWN